VDEFGVLLSQLETDEVCSVSAAFHCCGTVFAYLV